MLNWLNSNEALAEWVGVGATLLIGGLAFWIGIVQNKINKRLEQLQDYVAIAAVPREGHIALMNTGKSNLYLWGFDLLENIQRFEKPRLISVGTHDASYYWVPPPQTVGNFDLRLYLTDQFDNKWISESGGEVFKVEEEKLGAHVWTYRTFKENWKF